MKIVIDDKIPYIKGALEPFAEVVYLQGNKTTAEIVKDADAIITRTRTICNEQLLSQSAVKMIATATIGYDHIDTDWCEQNGIKWTNAPGCNSGSVEQYIASAIVTMAHQKGITLAGKTLGVVGVGNVGKKVARLGEIFGMQVLLNDPPRERAEGKGGFKSLDTLLEKCDFISLHVPLNMAGDDNTFHLANEKFFEKCLRKPVFINSCRGEVVKTEALKAAIAKGQLSGAVIDCWESEPDIDRELLAMVDLATPHIAGYSRDGKANGTAMSVQAVSRFFNLGINKWKCKEVEEPTTKDIIIEAAGKKLQQIITEAIWATYDIRNDDRMLRASVETFEKQRGDYPVRREFPFFNIFCNTNDIKAIKKLEQLGFRL